MVLLVLSGLQNHPGPIHGQRHDPSRRKRSRPQSHRNRNRRALLRNRRETHGTGGVRVLKKWHHWTEEEIVRTIRQTSLVSKVAVRDRQYGPPKVFSDGPGRYLVKRGQKKLKLSLPTAGVVYRKLVGFGVKLVNVHPSGLNHPVQRCIKLVDFFRRHLHRFSKRFFGETTVTK